MLFCSHIQNNFKTTNELNINNKTYISNMYIKDFNQFFFILNILLIKTMFYNFLVPVVFLITVISKNDQLNTTKQTLQTFYHYKQNFLMNCCFKSYYFLFDAS